MVQNIIDLGDREDRILNIVKAKFGLKNKSDAISLITKVYEEIIAAKDTRWRCTC